MKLFQNGIGIKSIKVIQSLLRAIERFKVGLVPDQEGRKTGPNTESNSVYLLYINDWHQWKLFEAKCNTRLFPYCGRRHDVNVIHTPNGLHQLIDDNHYNSLQNVYTYNSSKCEVIVYNESLSDYKTTKREWRLESSNIVESDIFRHLGALNENNMSLDDSVQEFSLN